MDKKKKVENLKAEELEKRTAPFAGLPDAVPDHAQADINVPGPRGGVGPKEFEVYEGGELNSPSPVPDDYNDDPRLDRDIQRMNEDN